jgi:hypothetical protein
MIHAVSIRRLRCLLSLAACAAVAACDPADEAPPATPQNATAPAAEPPAPAEPPPPEGQPGAEGEAPGPATQYGSPEYTVGQDTDSYDDDDPAALTDFHDTLSPYGTWVDDPTYGTVWVPSQGTVGADFRPYV